MKKKEIKVAMVGSGFAANIHGEAYHKVTGIDVKVVAIASKMPDQMKEFKKKYGFEDALEFDDAEKMIKEVDCDIVDVIVPTFLHVPISILAAEAGKHVICEKPLTGYFGDPSVPIEDRKDVGF